MKVQFGNLPALGWDERVARITDLARLCEEVGFDRFGIADYRREVRAIDSPRHRAQCLALRDSTSRSEMPEPSWGRAGSEGARRELG